MDAYRYAHIGDQVGQRVSNGEDGKPNDSIGQPKDEPESLKDDQY